MQRIEIYDTTLRDGSQGEGISFSLDDKLKVLQCLDNFRIDYVEGGWPGSNPKDIDFFHAACDIPLTHTKIAAFGSTRRPQVAAEDDANLNALVAAKTPVVTIFGKSWTLHVTEVFRTTLEENLRMIADSVRFLKAQGLHVIYDAEHYFDGYRADGSYALETLAAAAEAGADCLVLCDTNGGTLPKELAAAVAEARKKVPSCAVGIHAHNDSGVATANSIAAVEEGAVHVQGTFNGLGERCGNADLAVIIPNLLLKLKRELSISADDLGQLTPTSRFVMATANQAFRENQPYVGQMAFAHKGGVHVNSVMKLPQTYEHIDPSHVGNARRFLVSELSGKSNMQAIAGAEGIDVSADALKEAVLEIKRLENQGHVFEGAEASATLIMLRHMNKLPGFFELVRYRTAAEHRSHGGTFTEASVKIRVGEQTQLAVGEGVGPVDALDNALRNAIRGFYPEVDDIALTDYKVRIINAAEHTHAKVCVSIESFDKTRNALWGTVGANENIIEASWDALRDSFVYGLAHRRTDAFAEAEAEAEAGVAPSIGG